LRFEIMKLLWVALGVCGILSASDACSDTSSPLTCGSGTADVDGVCLPESAGGVGDTAGTTSEAAGKGDATEAGGGVAQAGSAAGASSATAGTFDAGGDLDGGATGGSNAGEAGAVMAGGEAGAGSDGNACTVGRIDCAPGVPFASSGSFTTSGSSDLIALDDTTALVGNHVNNSLNIFDLCSGTVKKSWPLPAQPQDIAFDARSRTAYVVLREQPSIAKIKLDGAGVTLIDLPKPAIMLTTGNHGRVFALLEDALAPKPAVSIVDGPGATVLNTFYNDYLSNRITYDHEADRLLGASDGGLVAFSFVEATNELVFAQYNHNTGGANCRQLVISPDQRHVVLTCGGGNTVTDSTGAYQVLDTDPGNLEVFYGLYHVGPYPDAAAFSPGGSYFFASGSGGAVLVFDVGTHSRIGEYAMRADQLSVSPSGRVLLGRQGEANASIFNWTLLNEPSDCR
ncbi:MAG TPA: hypothetical protein VNG33_05895, partial [Polyangiaceae bacterium]|nr:hypothetical protein [Polyangiaceae bacterium]